MDFYFTMFSKSRFLNQLAHHPLKQIKKLHLFRWSLVDDAGVEPATR